MLAPVASQLKLGLLRVAVLAKTGQVDDEWHVAAVPTEESHALEMGLGEGSTLHYNKDQQRTDEMGELK